MRSRLLILSALLAVLGVGGASSTAHADFFTFDPDGPGGPDSPVQIGGFDWAVGNSLAKSALPLAVGNDFQLYYQATLAGLIDTNGLTVIPAGLNGAAGAPAFQITVVGSITERVTSLGANPNSASFALAPVQSANSFLEIYFNNAVVANQLAGTGFNVGTRILAGTPNPALASSGNFTLAQDGSGNPIIQPFDQFGLNDYPGVSSVVGSGSALIGISITSQDPGFFLTQLLAGTTSFNTSNVTPFLSTDPSMLFTGLPGGAAPNIIPVIGTINGVNGTDFQFQADANETFAAAVPEPASMVLLVLGLSAGLLGRGWLSRQRRA